MSIAEAKIRNASQPSIIRNPRRPPAEDYECRGLSLSRVAILAGFAIAVIFVNKLGAAGNAIFFLIILMMLGSKPLTALIGVNLSLLALCANTAFVSKTVVWTFSRFLNMFLFAGRFGIGGGAGGAWMNSPSYVAISAFCVVAALCSLLSGYYVHIALLKLISFWVGISGFFACVYTLRRLKIDTTEWFVAQNAAVCGLAMLSLALGVGANFKESMLERGLYNLAFYHSQTMGPLAALMITYTTCVVLFTPYRNRWICLPIIAALGYCVALSGSRTGLGTLVVGLLAILTTAFLWSRKGLTRLRLNWSRPAILALILAAGLGLVATDLVTGGSVSGKFISFAAKKGKEAESVTLGEAIATRQGVAEQSYENFKNSPIYGIGFQVSKAEYFKQNATLFYAPVEKGFLPTAILEEVGLLGTIAFLLFLITMFADLVKQRNIPGFAMFCALLASNLGEVSIFALAGHGAYVWMLVVGGILLGDRCFLDKAALGRATLRHANQ